MKRFWLCVFCLSVSLALLLFVPVNAYQKEVSEKILRFHVVANSNSMEDQMLKLQVRDEVISFLSERLEACRSLGESKEIVSQNISEINTLVRTFLLSHGYNYPVKVFLGEQYFPVKTYGNMTFPRGYYEALTIHIGSGAGRNWWCVLFPNLCFNDAVTAYVSEDSKSLLEQQLEADAYEALLLGENVQIRFKIIDTIEAWLRK